jgi:hypothetical protein
LLRLLWLRLLGPLLLLLLWLLLPRLLGPLLRFRLALFFLLLVVLRVRRDNRPEEQKQGSGTGSSNILHSNRLPQIRNGVGTQTASPFDPHKSHP